MGIQTSNEIGPGDLAGSAGATSDSKPAHLGEFHLSVTDALKSQLLSRLDGMGVEQLTPDNLQHVREHGGVYRLFEGERLVYVGKSNSDLRGRLTRHHWKLSGRLPPGFADNIYFQCLYVTEDLTAVAPETMLITHYKSRDEAPWNSNGFGSNDPGKERDRSAVKKAHFDADHRINLDVTANLNVAKIKTSRQLAKAIKANLPFNFRFAKDLPALAISLRAPEARAARDWFALLARQLPTGWLILALPGYVICYPKTQIQEIPSATGRWTCGRGSTGFEPLSPTISPAALTPTEMRDGEDLD